MQSEESQSPPDAASFKRDFFVSRAGADAAWAEWIAWQLEAAGFTVAIQDWDFAPGVNFVHMMQQASKDAERTIAVLSPHYFNSPFTEAEWTTAFYRDPSGGKGLLLPIRVEDFQPPGMFGPRNCLDLFDLNKGTASERLLTWINRAGKQRGKPDREPNYPGKAKAPEQGAIPRSEPNYPGRMPFLFGLPPRNPNFSGRESLLHELRNHLATSKTAAVTAPTRPIATHGLGGTGKSQLAIEYAWRWASDYSWVVWLRAETPVTLGADFDLLAEKLRLFTGNKPTEQSKVIEAVRGYLEEYPGWLLIFDNAPEPGAVETAVPRVGGHVIFTSRYTAWGKSAAPLRVDVWQPEEAVQFLGQRLGLKNKQEGATDRRAAAELAHETGGLPLALEHAAAYCEQSSLSLTDYLSLFRENRLELFRPETLGFGLDDHEMVTVTTTWNLSLTRIRQEEKCPEAAALLNLCAFFDPDGIPLGMVKAGAEQLPELLSTAVRNELRLNNALASLLRYSLISVEGSGQDRVLSVHRLVQEVVRDRLAGGEKGQWLATALQIVLRSFPDNSQDASTWLVCGRLAPHAEAALRRAEHGKINPNVVLLVTRLALYNLGRGEYAKAEPLCQRALDMNERALGPDHPETAHSLNNLAGVYYNQGRYGDAEPLYQRTLAICEKALGPDHPNTAHRLNNLAILYYSQGRYGDAEPLYKRALDINEKALGPHHPETARSINNLALLYYNQGRYGDAEPLYQRALAICEKALGPDHPNTATSLNNLALLYYSQGRYGGAEPLYQRALDIRETALGPDHPDTAQSLNNLAGLCENQGRYGEAEPLYQRALAIREAALGPDHPDTAQSLNNLAGLYRNQGRYGDAEPPYQRALAIFEKALGPDHPETARSLNNLAGLYRNQGRYGDAEPLYQRALAIRETVLGPDHPHTAYSLNNLAGLYYSQGRYGDAEPLYKRALAIFEKALGPDHPNTASTRANYAKFLRSIGRGAKGDSMGREAN
jgi:tetratricopeptide (TPR) repeat protein